MSLSREVAGFLGRGLRSRLFPAAVARIEERGEVLAEVAAGETSPGCPVDSATVFDLASLTKPLATTPLALRRFAAPGRDLETPLGRLWPHLAATPLGPCPVSRLLDHTSGLQAWFPFYVRGSGRARMDDSLVRLARWARPPGRDVLYSDLGFLLLGRILERDAGQRLDRLFDREIGIPLALSRTRFRPPASWRGRVPPTEPGDRTERRMVVSRGLRFAGFLRRAARGIPGDVNARSLAGVAGHAGLFGTAEEVCRLVRLFLGDFPSVLPDPLGNLALRDRTVGLGPGRGLGWQTGREASPVNGVLGPGSFGHVGFTGTSVWCDPRRGRIAVLLTNRVHVPSTKTDFQEVRRDFHRIAFGGRSGCDSDGASC